MNNRLPTLLVLAMLLTPGLSATTADDDPGPTLSIPTLLIDDFTDPAGRSALDTRWRLATDQVMGGVSEATMTRRVIDGRAALCLTGDVRLENNGGFVQVNVGLAGDDDRRGFDAGGYRGVRLLVRGNGERYAVHLKTSATTLPWQSYRAAFTAGPEWTEVRLPFADFTPYRLVPALDPTRLRRLGIVAIGQAMRAEVCVAEVGFYTGRQGGAGF